MKATIKRGKFFLHAAIDRMGRRIPEAVGPPAGEVGGPELVGGTDADETTPELSEKEIAGFLSEIDAPEAEILPAPATQPAIPDGPTIRLFDPEVAQRLCRDVFETTENPDERLRLLADMANDARGGYRRLAVPQAQQIEALRALEATVAHLAAVIGIVTDAAEAAMRQETGFSCLPLLIAGPPGVGKTRLIKKIAQALEIPAIFLDGGMLDDTAILAGHSRSWRASRPGAVSRELIAGQAANTFLILDELDKVDGEHRYGPTIWSVLHGLLEPETARSWADSCLEVPMDVSRLIVIATANEPGALPASLVDRFVTITVDAPEGCDLAALIQAVSADVAGRFAISGVPLLDPDVMPLLAGLPPRRLRSVLTLAWARALSTGRNRPGTPEIRRAVRLIDAAKKQQIGFVTERQPASPARGPAPESVSRFSTEGNLK